MLLIIRRRRVFASKALARRQFSSIVIAWHQSMVILCQQYGFSASWGPSDKEIEGKERV